MKMRLSAEQMNSNKFQNKVLNLLTRWSHLGGKTGEYCYPDSCCASPAQKPGQNARRIIPYLGGRHIRLP